MQSKYIVNINPDAGEQCEVHTQWCKHLPSIENQLLLGHFDGYHEAIINAKALDYNAHPCPHCCFNLYVSDFLG